MEMSGIENQYLVDGLNWCSYWDLGRTGKGGFYERVLTRNWMIDLEQCLIILVRFGLNA